MVTRRSFLNHSLLASLSPLVPAFLSKTSQAMYSSRDDRILVVIQMSGGNDGLNTIIPFTNDLYAKARPTLRIDSKDVIRLNDSLGLHPAMKAAAELFNDGHLAVVPGVGYPNPDRSHFRSMSIWHSGNLDEASHTGQGWLGRAADISRVAASDPTSPDLVFVGEGSVPEAVIGRRSNTISLNNEKELQLAASLPTSNLQQPASDLNGFIQKSLDTSFVSARQFAESPIHASTGSLQYPDSAFGQRMKLLARMIRAGGSTRIFYTEQAGYDTHSGQRFVHEGLLRTFSTSLKAFLDDMKACGLEERIVVMAFSEFGRRVEENSSSGTDHGTSGPVFIAGTSIRPGLHGTYPSLSDLGDGDLKMTTDFRSIYCSLLENWMGIDSADILQGTFERMPLTL